MRSRELIATPRLAVPHKEPAVMVPVPEASWGDGLDASLFTHPVYLRAQGDSQVMCLRVPVLATGGRALFSQSGRHLTYLDRLSELAPAEIDAIAEIAFEHSDARFILFRDVQLRQEGSRITRPHRGYHYQANWARAVGPDETYLSSRRAKKLRQMNRRLNERLDAEVVFDFARTQDADIDAIGDFNRTKVHGVGGRYQMSAHKRDVLRQVAGQIGYTAALRAAGRLIAGSILCIAEPSAYGMIMGYDLEFSKFSQGLQSMHLAFGELPRLGCTRVNLLWGDSPYKADLGAIRRPLTTFVVCRNRRAFFDPALLWAAYPHAKLQLKRRVKAAIAWAAS